MAKSVATQPSLSIRNIAICDEWLEPSWLASMMTRWAPRPGIAEVITPVELSMTPHGVRVDAFSRLGVPLSISLSPTRDGGTTAIMEAVGYSAAVAEAAKYLQTLGYAVSPTAEPNRSALAALELFPIGSCFLFAAYVERLDQPVPFDGRVRGRVRNKSRGSG